MRRGSKGMSGGPTSDPSPGSWPALSIEHHEGPGEAFHHISWGCDRARKLGGDCS